MLKCDNTNTNGLFYDDIDTFNVLWCAQLGGRKCVISSTIATNENHLCPLLLLQSQLSPRNYPFYNYLHFIGSYISMELPKV